MAQQHSKRRQLSLNEVAQLVQRQCGMSTHEAHDLLEDILEHVGERLQAIQTARQVPLLPPVPPAAETSTPDALPYTEDWDPDFDPRKGLLLLRPDGTPPRDSDTAS
jgi:hypothetical protein